MLSVRDVHTYYGDSYVLQGVNLELQSGGFSRCWVAMASERPPWFDR